MNMYYRIENIKELQKLSILEKELVYKEYRKKEHPFQIELTIWCAIIPAVLYFSLKFYFEKVKNVEFGFNNIGLEILVFISSCIILGFLFRIIECNFIAPRVIRKIISTLDKKKNH